MYLYILLFVFLTFCDQCETSPQLNPNVAHIASTAQSRSCNCPQGLLQKCNELGAPYLFQKDKCYDVSYDTGDKSIQCGRHVDVFKLWLMWKAKVPSDVPFALFTCSHSAFQNTNISNKQNPEDVDIWVFKNPKKIPGVALGRLDSNE